MDRWSLDITHRRSSRSPWWYFDNMRSDANLSGEDAMRAARLLLPSVNANGASRRVVGDAVDYLAEAPAPEALFSRAARTFAKKERWAAVDQKVLLSALPPSVRLALEMSAHEDTERRALEGELHLLESAWRDAEEIAGIADDMFLPESIDAELKRLKGESP
jgi:hypothetical protein